MKRIKILLCAAAMGAIATMIPAIASDIPQRDIQSARSQLASSDIRTLASQKPMDKGLEGRSLDPRKHHSQGFSRRHTAASAPKRAGSSRSAAANGDYPEIFGSMIYSDAWGSSQQFGLYSVPTSSASAFKRLYTFARDCSYGGAVVDNVYYFNSLTDVGVFQYYESFGLNLLTGREVFYSDNTSDPILAQGMDTDPLSNTVYGIFYSPYTKKLSLATVAYGNNRAKKTVIADLGNDWYTAFAISSNGTFYAIKRNDDTGEGILGTMNRTTGEFTAIGSTGQYPYYLSGMAIDRLTDRIYWTVNPSDDTGYLVELDCNTGGSTLVYDFPNNEEIVGMYIPVAEALDDAPGACEEVSVVFEAGTLAGRVKLKSPSLTYGGKALNGNVDVHVVANGEEVKQIPGVAPGQAIDTDVALDTPGLYSFSVYASNSVGDGPKARIKEMWIGPDTPPATIAKASYADGKMTLSWQAVSQGINGGYLDPALLAYTVKDAEGDVVASDIRNTTYSFELKEPERLTPYYYTVTVTVGEVESAPARTNTVVLGSIMPPYTADFQSEINAYTILNSNGDANTWIVLGNGYMGIAYNENMDMDDWLVTPAMKLESGKGYVVSFVTGTENPMFPETIEVKYGKAPTADAMTGTLVPSTSIVEPITNGGTTFTQIFYPEETGTYYLGFHGISPADRYYLYLGDFQIETGVSIGAPDLVTSLTATPASGGILECKVAFDAPVNTLGGEPLASISRIDLYRGDVLIHTFPAPVPGSSLAFTDTEAPAGDVTYTVIASNSEGEGMKARISTFVGFNKPLSPASVNVSRTDVVGEVAVEWEAVTQDLGGETLTADDVTYTVCIYSNGWIPIAENLKTTSYVFQAVAPGSQEFVSLAVFAKTIAGMGQGTTSDMIPVGTPYDGMNETFKNAALQYIWGYSEIGECFVNIYDDSSFSNTSSVGGDNGFIGILANEIGSGGNLYSGLISLENMANPAISFFTSNINGDDTNTVGVSVKPSDAEDWIEVMPSTSINRLLPGAPGWGKVVLPLSAYAGKTLQVQLTGIVRGYKNIFFDDIKVANLPDYDLAVKSITSPANVTAGESFEIEVAIANEGVRGSGAYSVELYASSKLADVLQLPSLAAGESCVATFSRTISPLVTEPVAFYAKVVLASDQDPANDISATINVTPMISTLPSPSGLEAETQESSGIRLTWNAPDLSAGISRKVVDDFEDADGIAAAYGDWTFVDVDNVAVGGIRGVTIPGITSGVTKGSFWVWDNEVMQGNSSYTAHSGNKFLFSLYRADGKACNDWAVSPLLSGQSQKISFYARSLSADYPEAIQVLWSSQEGVNASRFNTTAFTSLVNISSVPAQWTLYEVELPAGARHFAIRSYASNSFMLMIDDVTYSVSAPTDMRVEGYNIYRDGEKLTVSPVTSTEYADAGVVPGETYTYVVTAVYAPAGESAPSNAVTIKNDASAVAGIAGNVKVFADGSDIVILNAEGLGVSVVSAAASVVYSGTAGDRTVVGVQPGVYIVKVGSATWKLYVR